MKNKLENGFGSSWDDLYFVALGLSLKVLSTNNPDVWTALFKQPLL
jgi:hypothetical protein